MVAQGIGKALLPRIVGDAAPRLVRLQDDFPDLAVPVWVACLKEFGRTPRFALVQRLLVEALNEAIGRGV